MTPGPNGMECHLFLFICVTDSCRENQDDVYCFVSSIGLRCEISCACSVVLSHCPINWGQQILADHATGCKHSFPGKKWPVPAGLEGATARVPLVWEDYLKSLGFVYSSE